MTITPYSFIKHSEIVAEWWKAHTGREFQHALLPPLGLVCSDESGPCCAVWLYMSVGVGVAFLENPVTRPGLSLQKSKAALSEVFTAMEAVALTHDYGVMNCHSLAAGRRLMESLGYIFSDAAFISGSKLLRTCPQQS